MLHGEADLCRGSLPGIKGLTVRTSITIYALLLAAVLAAAVVANGGRTPFEWNLCVGAMGLLALAIATRAGRGSEPQAARLTALALLAPAYVAFQLLPLPLPLLRLLAPRRAGIADKVGTVMPGSWAAPISIEPASTATILMTVIACALCFLIVRHLTSSSLRKGSWLTVYPLVAIGVFEGALALWEAWHGEVVDGTFWNRNHLAGMLEMVLPFGVAYVLVTRRNDRARRPPTTARGMLWSVVIGTALPMMAVVVILAGVLASASKMGYVAALFGLLAMGFAAVLTRLSGAAKWVSIAALPILAIAGFVLLANQDVLTRLAGALDSPDGLSGEGRLPIWADSLRLFAANPFFGSGLGTYATAFLGFQTSSVSFHWTHAHNDYIEMATDLGIIGSAVFGALLLTAAGRAIRLARPVRQSGSDLVALGCIGAFAAIALHSVVDFNLTVPANLLLLSWIAGIAAGIPDPQVGALEGERRASLQGRQLDERRAWLQPRQLDRIAILALATVAVVMSAAALIAGTPAPPPDPATLEQRLQAMRKSPASPYRWLDLAEGFVASGQTAQANASVLNALALGVDVPPVIRRSATLLDALGDRPHAVTLVLRVLRQTGDDDAEVFDWFAERRIPVADVLAGLAGDRRALQAYLRSLMLPGTCNEAELAWRQLVTRHRPDGKVATDYVYFLQGECDRAGAAIQAWGDYARQSMPEYQVSNWVFNGDFEKDPAPVQFDWHWNPRTNEADAALDNIEKFSGARSLRMVFRGPSRTNYAGAIQTVSVTPGTYRFTAAVRSLGLKSADGIRFQLSSIGSAPGFEVRTEQVTGTTAWQTITADVVIPDGVTLLGIQIVRRTGPGAADEEDLSGTVWVDAVTLSRVGSSSR